MQFETGRALIADHLAVDIVKVCDDANFASDLGADSLDMVELAMRFEEKFDIFIDDNETEFCGTVGAALKLVHGKIAQRRAA